MAASRRKIIATVYMPKWTDLPDGSAFTEFMPDARPLPRTRSAAAPRRTELRGGGAINRTLTVDLGSAENCFRPKSLNYIE